MRKLFQERLDQLAVQLQDMVARAEQAMRDATTALFTADTALAESVINGHDDVKAHQAAVDEIVLSLLAREQLYRALLAGTAGLDAQVAVELALIGRYCERYADHAMALGRYVAYPAGRDALDPAASTTRA